MVARPKQERAVAVGGVHRSPCRAQFRAGVADSHGRRVADWSAKIVDSKLIARAKIIGDIQERRFRAAEREGTFGIESRVSSPKKRGWACRCGGPSRTNDYRRVGRTRDASETRKSAVGLGIVARV